MSNSENRCLTFISAKLKVRRLIIAPTGCKVILAVSLLQKLLVFTKEGKRSKRGQNFQYLRLMTSTS